MSSELTDRPLASRSFPGLDETSVVRLAQDLAQTAPHHGLVFLVGDLGAGKTTFARAFLRALGVVGPVRSPTYTLIEPYDLVEEGGGGSGSRAQGGGPRRVLHLDLYRLGAPDELDYLGLRDEFDQALILIEWPVRAASELPLPDLEIHLARMSLAEPDHRQLTLSAGTARGTLWFQACQSRYDVRGD